MIPISDQVIMMKVEIGLNVILKIRKLVQLIIQTRNNDYCNPVNWVIEVSNTDNDEDWKVIDSRINVKSVSKRSQYDTFDISTPLSDREYYRYIRFRSTGKTSGDCNHLAITLLEYFGYLIE